MSPLGETRSPPDDLRGRVALLATQHGKERAIAPVLEAELGLRVEVVAVDTDRFGTFTREVARRGSQLDAAREKARAALEGRRGGLGLASEGSFGPHPVLPFVTLGVELVVLLDPASGLELVGRDATLETNFASGEVRSFEEARALARRCGFPEHGLVVMSAPDAAGAEIQKGVRDEAALASLVERWVSTRGSAWIEADMRAHVNPTRMRSIERAAADLARAARSLCPACGARGFVPSSTLTGLPCADCGAPTTLARARVSVCAGCSHRREDPVDAAAAPAASCAWCNP